MPAPMLKFLAIFQEAAGYGWSELHYKMAGSESPNLQTALTNFMTGIVPSRVAILGESAAFVGARVSYRRAGAIASHATRQFFGGVSGKKSSGPSTSLAIQLSNADGTQKKILHLRGFWDAVEENAGYNPAGDPLWEARLNAYKDALIANSYGWPTKDPATSAVGNVTNYVVSDDPRVTFTVAATSGALPAAGTIINVRFSRLNNGKSNLNRSLLCTVVNATTLTTVPLVASGTFLSAGRFNYRSTSFVAYNVMGSVSLGERRQGKVLNRYPGRAAAKPLA